MAKLSKKNYLHVNSGIRPITPLRSTSEIPQAILQASSRLRETIITMEILDIAIALMAHAVRPGEEPSILEVIAEGKVLR